MTVFWAFVDSEGNIVTRGQCAAHDLFLQELPEGLTAVVRPEHITEADGWKYINEVWTQQRNT